MMQEEEDAPRTGLPVSSGLLILPQAGGLTSLSQPEFEWEFNSFISFLSFFLFF